MEEDNKFPLKRVEFALNKFNEVAIPHHLDLLRQHKANIIKWEEAGEYRRMAAEQERARRVAAQLRALLREVETLRAAVRKDDHRRFDDVTRRARETTLAAIVDYLGMIEHGCMVIAGQRRRETSPLAINRGAEDDDVSGSVASTDSVGVVAHAQAQAQMQVPLQEQKTDLRSRERALQGWVELQSDVRALHGAWATLHRLAVEQRPEVDSVERNVDVAAVNVQAGRRHLAAAERLKAGAYGLGGAALGAAVGGPLGLAVGAKAGAAAAAAGSLLGWLGARMLGRKRQMQLEETNEDTDRDNEHKDKRE